MYMYVAQNKGADQLRADIYAFIFTFTKDRFSYDTAHIVLLELLVGLKPYVLLDMQTYKG